MILDDQSCVERARSCTVLFHFDALCANCPHHAAEGRDDCPYHRTCRGPRHYLLHATPNLRSQRLHWMSQRNFAAKSLSRPDVQVLLTMAPPGFDAQTCDGNGWALIHHAVSTTQAPGESGPSFLRWLIDRPENGVDLAQLTAGIALDRASFPFYGPRMLQAFSWADACVLAAVNLLPASRNELNLSTHETIDQFFTPTATASLFADQTRFNIIDGSHRVPAYAPSTTTPGARPIRDHLPILDATDQSLFSLPHYVPTRQRENRP